MALSKKKKKNTQTLHSLILKPLSQPLHRRPHKPVCVCDVLSFYLLPFDCWYIFKYLQQSQQRTFISIFRLKTELTPELIQTDDDVIKWQIWTNIGGLWWGRMAHLMFKLYSKLKLLSTHFRVKTDRNSYPEQSVPSGQWTEDDDHCHWLSVFKQ